MSDPIREALERAKVFAEYASYCLEPGKSVIGSQFPHQDDATALIAQLTAAIALMDKPELEVWLCPVHQDLDKYGVLKPLDNCVACLRNERDELKEAADKPHPDTERLTKYRNSPGPTGYPRWLEDEISECRAAHSGMRCDSETLCNLHESKARGAA